LAEIALIVIDPAVIKAPQDTRLAAALAQDLRGAVAADIVKAAQGPVLAADDEDRPAGDILRVIRSWLAHARFMPEQQPFIEEDRLALGFIYGRVVVPARRQGHCIAGGALV